MSRLYKLLPLVLGTLTAAALAPSGCTSDNTSTKGQMISCSVSGGVVANCHPMTATDVAGAPGTCQDVDEDGDGEPDDVNEEMEGSGAATADDGDKDHDGTPDSMDQDDDNDGVPDTNDCDNEPGGDNPAGGAHD